MTDVSTICVEVIFRVNARSVRQFDCWVDQTVLIRAVWQTSQWLWRWLPHRFSNVSHYQQQSFSGLQPTWTINQPQTLTHLGHNQQQSSSGLRQPGRSTNHKHWLTWVTNNNSPSQDFANPDDQPTTNIDSPGSQTTTVLLRTTPTWTINQPQTLTHLGHN